MAGVTHHSPPLTHRSKVMTLSICLVCGNRSKGVQSVTVAGVTHHPSPLTHRSKVMTLSICLVCGNKSKGVQSVTVAGVTHHPPLTRSPLESNHTLYMPSLGKQVEGRTVRHCGRCHPSPAVTRSPLESDDTLYMPSLWEQVEGRAVRHCISGIHDQPGIACYVYI